MDTLVQERLQIRAQLRDIARQSQLVGRRSVHQKSRESVLSLCPRLKFILKKLLYDSNFNTNVTAAFLEMERSKRRSAVPQTSTNLEIAEHILENCSTDELVCVDPTTPSETRWYHVADKWFTCYKTQQAMLDVCNAKNLPIPTCYADALQTASTAVSSSSSEVALQTMAPLPNSLRTRHHRFRKKWGFKLRRLQWREPVTTPIVQAKATCLKFRAHFSFGRLASHKNHVTGSSFRDQKLGTEMGQFY